jgi:hypothetical protein
MTPCQLPIRAKTAESKLGSALPGRTSEEKLSDPLICTARVKISRYMQGSENRPVHYNRDLSVVAEDNPPFGISVLELHVVNVRAARTHALERDRLYST